MTELFYQTAKMNQEQCNGAAIFMCFIIGLFTMSARASFTPAEVVNILDMASRRELPNGLMDTVR